QRVLAHELAHSLGPYNARHRFEEASRAAGRFRKLREATCGGEPLPCAAWEDWKKGFSKDLRQMKSFKVERAEVLGCLTTRKIAEAPESRYFDRLARERVIDQIESTAASEQFLKLIKEK